MKKNHGDIIILHMCTINDNHIIYGSWDVECGRQNFLSFWTIFLISPPPKNLKNQNFEKMKKSPEDIIILQMCTINKNHMMYDSWDMECDRQNFLSFWTIFWAFTPNPKKIKILKKWNTSLEIIFYKSVSKITIICYTVPKIWHVLVVIVVFHFGLFFALLSPPPPAHPSTLNRPKNKNVKKI